LGGEIYRNGGAKMVSRGGRGGGRGGGVRETGLGSVEFVGGKGDSGFGGVGFRETVGLGKAVSEGEATPEQRE
jgi:hypothetical protein